MKKLVIIDGHSLLYRAYFAMIRNPLFNSKGQNTSALHGFLNMYNRMINDFAPDSVCVVQDKVRGGFRKEIYEDYKANRDATPDDLKSQFPLFDEMLQKMNITSLHHPNFEGDDIIGSIVEKYKNDKEHMIYVVSGDKDLFQVLNFAENVRIVNTKKGLSNVKIYDKKVFEEEYGFHPEQMIDYKALVGDKSDNIPGVKGVGDKTAQKLLKEYKTIENLYEHVDEIKGAVQKKLINDKENAFLSYKLAKISREFPVDFDIDEFKLDKHYNDDFFAFLMEMEFVSMIDKFSGGEGIIETAKKSDGEYVLINKKEDFEKLLEHLNEYEHICFDTETDSLNTTELKIVGISLCVEEKKAYYIPIGHFYLGVEAQLDRKYVLDKLVLLFKKKKVIGHNLKFDFLVLKKYGYDFPIYFDTSLAHYIVDPDYSHGLKKLAKYYFNIEMTEYDDIVPKNSTMANVDIKDTVLYAGADADLTFRLYNILKKELEEKEVLKLFTEIEMPLVKTLIHMEYHGIKLNTEYLSELSKDYTFKMKELEKEIFNIAGEEFNIDSPKQLSSILFEKMGIEPVKKTKTGFSTNQAVLEKLALKNIDIAEKLLKYRNLTKLLNTYINTLPDLTDKHSVIHTNFNQTITTTGRLSSSNPNLQNIPVRNKEGIAIRNAFIARENKKLLSFDYSQIELRVLAHLSEDKILCDAFKNGNDIHTISSSNIFHVDPAEVTKEMRRVGKMINFGIVYGMNAYGLVSRLNISNSEAKQYIDNFFHKFCGVREYLECVKDEAKKNMFVKTLFGRKRYLNGLSTKNIERAAVNSPVQGSAADLIKIAMNNCFKELNLDFNVNSDIKMLLQIHDELVFEVTDNENILQDYSKRIIQIMENCVKLRVPLKVDMSEAYNLGTMKEV